MAGRVTVGTRDGKEAGTGMAMELPYTSLKAAGRSITPFTTPRQPVTMAGTRAGATAGR